MDNIRDKEKIYLDRLSAKFNKEHFCEFIGDLLNLESTDIINGTEQSPTSEQYRNYIETAQEYAKYTDNKRNIIGIIIVKLKANKNPTNARTLQRNYIAHLLDYYNLDAALSAIYSDTDDSWRLSFVKKEISINVGKIETKLSPAKRYSYLFGKDEPNHTAKNQLFELLKNNEKKYTIDEIEEQFSVEKVTKDFFEKYKDNYLKIKEMLEKNEDFISESKRCDFTSEEFTKKLMGQLVFLYFLQKKGWLGVPLVPQFLSVEEYNQIYDVSDTIQKKVLNDYYITHEGRKRIINAKIEKVNENKQELEILSDIFVGSKYDKNWGMGQKSFVKKIYNKAVNMKKNFFDEFLEPFFYEGLNNYRKNQYFGLFNSKVPFLNGGLFEPLDNYNWKVAKFKIDNSVFSNENKDGILDFFERYNFTMNEEEPLEKEVAVDPEMLGKIFENLLDVKDRKSKGAFYTPREIVHYMCQESLANFLVNKVGVDYGEIKEFIQYGEMIRDEDIKNATKNMHLLGDTVFNNITAVDKALEKIKIADPAVGSGAFPLGMLNEIVKLRDIITSYMLIYNRLGLFDRKYPEEAIYKKRSIYNIKWNTIKNCIYAVDIENSAVDITKLRLWLSIVVDQDEVPREGPQPLPNLDCKIMQGNSLIDEFNGIKLIDEELIEKSKDDFVIKAENKKNIDNQMRFFDTTPEFAQLGFYTDEKRALINSLIKTKSDLFGTNITSEKKRLLDKIKSYREELFKVNFRSSGTKSIDELLEIDKCHSKPYFSWELEFIEVFVENEGFDIVIGNPPYGAKFSAKEKQILDKNYRNIPDYESYYYFITFGRKILNKRGFLSYINPNMFMANSFAKNFRKEILELWNIINIDELSDYDVFKSAKVRTCIINFQKEMHNINLKVKFNIPKYSDSYRIDTTKEFTKNELLEHIDNWLSLFKMNLRDIEILKTIKENSKSITELGCIVSQGLIPYDKYRGHSEEIIKNRIWHSNYKKDDTYKKELKGEDVKRYNIKWNGNNWISYGEWLAAPREKRFFTKPRILVREITNPRILAGYTELEYYNTPSIINIINFEECEAKYILGIINSKLMSYYSSLTSPKAKKGLFPKILVNDVRNLPIKINDKYYDKLIKLVNKYVEEYEQMTENDVFETERIIDDMVFDIYEINQEDREYILGVIK